MKFLKDLIKKEKVLQRNTGLNHKQLNVLVKRLEPLWENAEIKRKNREGRKRKVGGGHPYKLLLLEHKIIAVLLYYKLYITQEFLGLILDIDQANIARLVKKLSPLIELAADPELATYLAKAKADGADRINDWASFLQKYPDLRDVSTDATEQRCFRSQDYDTQKKYYSGKKKCHALKTEISAAQSGRIMNVSQTYPGSMHDKNIIDQEQTPNKFPQRTAQRFDGGYQGIVQKYPNHYIILAHKKPRGKELSSLAKELNQMNSRRRIIVEHVLSRIKKFRICSDLYRGNIDKYNQIFRGVAALVNFKLITI